MKIDVKKACALTGHRDLPEDFDRIVLEMEFIKLIDRGYTIFLVGMAMGFDMLSFKILERLKKNNKKIKLIACVPCKDQAKRYPYLIKKEYERMIDSADEVKVLSDSYTPYCMMKRNIYMVDNCSVLLCYLRANSGGTKNTVSYAEGKNKEIIRI